MSKRGTQSAGLKKRLGRLKRAAANALDLVQQGRLGAPYQAPHEVALASGIFRLRRYTASNDAADGGDEALAPVLLIPPLMVTSEIYDISPELSAVSYLKRAGVDVWLVDFGRPEMEEGGMDRTLDDHVLAVDQAISHVHETTGQSVHLVGYSQGGMFAYQSAAYRRGRQVGSVITFGSPVDLRRNLPVPIHETLAARLISVARRALDGPIKDLQGLPGTLTSRGFKLLSPKQELKQLVGVLGLLHDRDALERREPRRRFLGGEGFIAWPGPAFRQVVDDFLVGNRMRTGGFVVDGRTVSLADLTIPILHVVGRRDDIARPAAVRAIREAAPKAQHDGLEIAAGHFGLVVGSRALMESWPTVVAWVAWHSGVGERPEILDRASDVDVDEEEPEDNGSRRLYDLATDLIDGLWHRLGETSLEVTGLLGALRWQLPRLARLVSLRDTSRVNLGRLLEDQAQAIPDATFFVWEGRAYSYGEANIRVNQFLGALVSLDVHPGDQVGILMDNHPDYLTVAMALVRLGAVPVLLNAGAQGEALIQACQVGEVRCVVVDPAHREAIAPLPHRSVLMVGPGEVPDGVVHVDARVDPGVTQAPEGIAANPGRAADLAMLMFTSGTTGLPKAARITNRRVMVAALGAAAACELRPTDTVYCCLPLHHATAMLVACGGALAGGARLALAPRFSSSTFWSDVRRYGASVVFYVGELCRYLVSQPVEGDEREHPVRLFVGNGMREDVWHRMQERFGGLRILEFYGSTEGNVVLANLTGDKPGSIGRPLWTDQELLVAAYDVENGRLIRDEEGRVLPCGPEEPGLLLCRIVDERPLARFDGYVNGEETARKVVRDALSEGDAWFTTGDLVRRDEDGDYWFEDRLGDTFRWKGENVSTEQVEGVLERAPSVRMSAAYGVRLPGREGRAGMAALVLEEGASFDGSAMYQALSGNLSPAARPRFLRVVDALPMTESLKVKRRVLQDEGCDPGRLTGPLYWHDAEAETYAPLDMDTYARLMESPVR